MINISHFIPADAIYIETSDYFAWTSRDGSEVCIDVRFPNTHVTESILLSVVQRVYEEGGSPEKVIIPDSAALGTPDYYDTDFGLFEIIDLKRQEAEAKARETREFLAEKAQVIAEHMYEVMKDENSSIDLRRRAAEFIAEASMPKVAGVEFVNVLNLYRNDIALFAKQVFGAELTADQIKFCEEFRTERTITRHEPPAWGKTYVAAIAVWWSLVCFDDVRVTIFAPSEVGIRCGIWRELQALHARMAAPFKDLFYVGMVRISRKSDPRRCFAEMRLAGDDIASARGIHAKNNFVFVDDADGVSEEVIANLHGIFNDPNPKLCLLSSDMSEFTKAKPDAAELFNRLAKALDDIHSFGDELWKRHPGLVDVNTMIASIVEQKRNESTVAYYIDRLNRAVEVEADLR